MQSRVEQGKRRMQCLPKRALPVKISLKGRPVQSPQSSTIRCSAFGLLSNSEEVTSLSVIFLPSIKLVVPYSEQLH